MALSPAQAIPPRRPMPGSVDSLYSSTVSPISGGQVPDGEVVVGHHRGGMEQPPHVVAPAAGLAHSSAPRRHRELDAGDVARAGTGQEDDRLGHVGRVDMAPQ